MAVHRDAPATAAGVLWSNALASRDANAAPYDQLHELEQIGDRIAEQTDRKVDLQSKVDPDILGGIVVRVGNSVLDASIRNRLENFRKQVARAS